MKDLSKHPLFMFGIGAFFALLLYFFVSYFDPTDQKLKTAYESYQLGEQATSAAERTDAFNRSLAIYHELEMRKKPELGNGKLYFNIGNNYFQLGQYSLAAYYYQKALKLAPRDQTIRQNLEITNKKLGITSVSKQSAFERIFFWHASLSLPERLQLFFISIILFLASASAYIWLKKNWIKSVSFLTGLLTLVFFVSVFHARYIANAEGVVIQSTPIYRDAGTQYALSSPEPVPAGTKVDVLDILENGKWLKVTTPDGTLGYVSSESTRVL